jgi:hypothetical protein
MNFNDSSSDRKVGSKPAERKSNEAGQTPGSSSVDRAAMDSAQKAQDRMHKNEQTNSSNTTFTK